MPNRIAYSQNSLEPELIKNQRELSKIEICFSLSGFWLKNFLSQANYYLCNSIHLNVIVLFGAVSEFQMFYMQSVDHRRR
jgi:hypothetical protein